MSHQERLDQIAQIHLMNDYTFYIVAVVFPLLMGWLFWIAVDNWTRYRIEDDFERIEPPQIDWDKVDL